MSTKRKRKRRVFSEEFKRDAVNLVVVEGYTIAAAARAVNVLDGSLRDWHRKYAPGCIVVDVGPEPVTAIESNVMSAIAETAGA